MATTANYSWNKPAATDTSGVRTDINAILDAIDTSVKAVADAAVAKALFDAGTFLYATSDNTPAPKTAAEVRAILDAVYDTTVGIAYGLSVGNADTAMTANQAYWVRINIDRSFAANRFGIHVVTQAGNLDFAIASDSSGTPGALLYHSGSTACPATGRQLVTITETNIPRGPVWLGLAADATPATLTFGTARSGRAVNPYRVKATSFPIPDPAATTGPVDNGPLMWLERA